MFNIIDNYFSSFPSISTERARACTGIRQLPHLDILLRDKDGVGMTELRPYPAWFCVSCQH
jgi:hypothetical protein